MSERAPLALLVGPDTNERSELAQRLVERGWPSVVCSGPPDCPLLVEDRCALVDVADVAVFMPRRSADREVRAELSLCAHEAKTPVIIEPSLIDPIPDAAVLTRSTDTESVLEAIDEAVARKQRLINRRAVADVADIWL